jgi:DNA helicase-2/ATP-dependent DNA helicase PcrA
MAVIPTPTFRPSSYQEDVYQWVVAGTGDGIINACAGAGKTSTLVEVAQLLPRGKALFCAFNKHIVAALRERLHGTEFDVQTLHGIGYRTLCKTFPRLTIDKQKYRRLCRQWIDTHLRRLPQAAIVSPTRETVPRLRLFSADQLQEWDQALEQLVHFTRLTLTNPDDPEALRSVARRFGVVVDAAVFPGVRAVLDEGIALTHSGGIIDYTDMLWLPSTLGLRPERFRWVLVDEAQDLNAAQLALALRCRARGGRMLFCGDPFQSIMAFSGADPEAYAHIKAATSAAELPLSICYRCPTSHLDLARKLVPTIEARTDAPEGRVITLPEADLPAHLDSGDLVLCRYSAPLVAWAIRLIAARIPARVKGRDVVADLAALARTLAALVPWSRFYEAIDVYEQIQVSRLLQEEAEEEAIAVVVDRCKVLRTFMDGYKPRSVDSLCDAIDTLFSDEQATVWLSTIHRAKGLEADRVFLLEANTLPRTWPHQRAVSAQQERNILYVALTRAKQDLFLVLTPEEDPGGTFTSPERASQGVESLGLRSRN